MTLDPATLQHDLELLEAIERATLRLVVQAIYEFRKEADEIFSAEQDRVAYIGEDITREALDRLGTSVIPVRLFGNIDYKRARYIFHPQFSLRQALFVDSKAEKVEGQGTATIQTAQTSLKIRQIRGGKPIEEVGTLPVVVHRDEGGLLTTTIFVKYNYQELEGPRYELASTSIICLPNGMLQERYNPTAQDSFWRVGRNAPSRGEVFRVRISLNRLAQKARWRVQRIQVRPTPLFRWNE